MKAFETFAIYITPFLVFGAAVRFLMKRYAVDLSDVEKAGGPQTKAQISPRGLAHRRVRPHDVAIANGRIVNKRARL